MYAFAPDRKRKRDACKFFIIRMTDSHTDSYSDAAAEVIANGMLYLLHSIFVLTSLAYTKILAGTPGSDRSAGT